MIKIKRNKKGDLVTKNISVDVGNFSNKVIAGETRNLVESRIELADTKDLLDAKNSFTFNGFLYKIKSENFDSSSFKINKKMLLVNLFYSIASTLGESSQVNLAVGLPISQFKSDKDELKRIILDNSTGTLIINEKEITIEIKDVTVVAEGLGAFYSIYDKFIDLSLEDISIIDLGGKTTDICTINEDNAVTYHTTIFFGAFDTYKDIVNFMADDKELRKFFFGISDISRMLDKGLYRLGEKIETSFTEDILRYSAKEIYNAINSDNERVLSSTILITGGHGYRLYPYLKELIPGALLHSDHLYANALGYYEMLEW